MKIMLSISQFYCRGLIYQALPRDSPDGFDKSNPYDQIYIMKDVVFSRQQKNQ